MANDWTPEQGIPNLDGKITVVTGANSGIGFETVKALAAKGAKVYFTARSEEKAKNAQNEQLRLNPSLSAEKIPYLLMDLEDIESVLKASEQLRAKEDKVDILIDNAGGVTQDIEHTKNGWERAIATCHIGHFVFANGIISLLKKAAAEPNSDVRVITISSNAHHMFLPTNYPLNFNDKSVLYGQLPYIPWIYRNIAQRFVINKNFFHYAVAKTATTLFASQLQKLMDKHGVPILSISMHPQAVWTEDLPTLFKPWVWWLMKGNFVTPAVGAYHTLYAATSKEAREKEDLYKGSYLEPIGNIHPGHPIIHNTEQAEALWDTTEREVNEYLAKNGHSPLQAW